jgi:predicted DNA-binding antitoxin AbrB/MazE fold protein
MTVTLIATYENGVLHLPQPLDLPENTQVQVRIEPVPPVEAEAGATVLQCLLSLATDLGVDDLAEQHDHYLYGTEKR